MIRFLIILFLVSSCSIATLVMGKLDFFISNEIAQNLDLYYRQEQMLDKDISSWLNSSKSFAIKALDRIKSIKARATSGKIDKEEVKNEMAIFQNIMGSWLQTIVPILSKYLSALDAEQQKHFFKKWDSKTQDFKEKVEQKNLKHSYERFHLYFGELTKEQIDKFKENEQYYLKRKQQQLDRRVEFTDRFTEAFKQKKNQKEFEILITEMIKLTLYPEKFEIYQNVTYDILSTLTSEQKEKFLEKMTFFETVLSAFIKNDY